MEFEELKELRAKADQSLECMINSLNEPTLISKSIWFLFMQVRFLGIAIDHLQESHMKLQESHMKLMDEVSKLQEQYIEDNSVSELVVGD